MIASPRPHRALGRTVRRVACLTLAAALVAGGAAPLRAQDAVTLAPTKTTATRLPKRPSLSMVVDTNDALQYYIAGQQQLERNPDVAAAAFYWAGRIDPGFAESFYARRAAMLLARPRQFADVWWRGNEKVAASPEMRQIDSLAYRAYLLNPLLDRRVDGQLMRALMHEVVTESVRRSGGGSDVSPAEIDYFINTTLLNSDAATRAMFSLADGNVPASLKLYQDAIKKARREDRAQLHVDRARAWVRGQQPDSAIAEFGAALADLRSRDAKVTVRWYEPKAVYEHSVGMLYEAAGRDSAARAAYGRALEEDLSYFPAHLRLAELATAANDTGMAVTELESALQLRPEDAVVRYRLATALVRAGRGGEAPPHLEKAIAAEPWYAEPRLLLARLYDASEMPEQAVEHYRAYVKLASARAGTVDAVNARVAALAQAAPAGSR